MNKNWTWPPDYFDALALEASYQKFEDYLVAKYGLSILERTYSREKERQLHAAKASEISIRSEISIAEACERFVNLLHRKEEDGFPQKQVSEKRTTH